MQITSKYPFTQLSGPAAEISAQTARDSVKATVDTFLHACGQASDHPLQMQGASGLNFFAAGSGDHARTETSDAVAHAVAHAILDSVGPQQLGVSHAHRSHASHARYEDVLTRAMSAREPGERSALLREARALLVADGFNISK